MDEVFTAMRRLAIREENTMVARVTLHNMRQDRDEPICAFVARLRGQASVHATMYKMRCQRGLHRGHDQRRTLQGSGRHRDTDMRQEPIYDVGTGL